MRKKNSSGIYMYSVRLLLTLSVLSVAACTIDINIPEFQYLSDHLTEEECRRLVASLHFQTFELPEQAGAAERRLPDDVSCFELLLHWNSQAGEGKGNTHVEVAHRLNQIGRRDLAEWLSKTVFHQLSKDLDDSMVFLIREDTTRMPRKATERGKHGSGEVPWLNVDSIMAILLLLAVIAFVGGCCYMMGLCCERFRNARINRNSAREKSKKFMSKQKEDLGSSEDEIADLISKKGSKLRNH